ncbi:MAG: 3-deoxy-7-phosphoheptulonate synthase [Dehalococcoidia bacterium]
MIVVMKPGYSQNEINQVTKRIEDAGLKTHISEGVEHTVIGVLGKVFPELRDSLAVLPGVEQVILVTKPYKLASREFHPKDTVVKINNDVAVGGNEIVVMAGPCAIESEEQLLTTAKAVKAAGATVLRGGAFKPRTSPYDFRGLGATGLQILAAVGKEVDMPVVTEVMAPHDVDLVARHVDILQIGARNMQNFILLDEVGRVNKPMLLKRGLSSTIQEWLLAAEYVLNQGNENVILCERGIRTFETYTRNTMDLSSIPVVEKVSHLPIIADPSHATGTSYLVTPLALAAIAAGADGLLIEVHHNPESALADGPQSLNFDAFRLLMFQLSLVAQAKSRSLATLSVRTKS